MDSDHERLPGEWFAECMNAFSNEGLAAFLSAQVSGYESELKSEEVPCNDGVPRPLFRILGRHVRQLLKLQEGSNVLKFRIWWRGHDGLDAYPKDFIGSEERPRSSGPFKSGADRLKAIKAARAAKVT